MFRALVACSLILAVFASSGVVGETPTLTDAVQPAPAADAPAEPVTPAPAAHHQAESSAPADPEGPANLGELLAQAEQDLQLGDGPVPPGIAAMRLMMQPNGTDNGTVVGTAQQTTHRHGHLGDEGLSPVWATPFLGTARVIVHMDLDGDGKEDTLVGSDIALTAVSSKGKVLWAHHIGSSIVDAFPIQIDDGPMEIGFATTWGAQNPQIAVLRSNGDEVWRYEGQAGFVAAGTAQDGQDIVAVDAFGTHMRLGSVSGDVVWEFTTGQGIPVAYHLGPWAAATGDVNGDGVTDTVAAHLYWLWGPAGPTDRDFSIIYAVDGATGEQLWLHDMGGLPGEFARHVPLDLEVLDADGDGDDDVAVSGYSYSYLEGRRIYSAHLRIIEGDSDTVATPILFRDIPQPDVLVESYRDLGSHDSDGDGAEELLVLRYSLINGLTTGTEAQLERYTAQTAITDGETGGFVSDITVDVGPNVALLDTIETASGPQVPLVWSEGLDGSLAFLETDGSITDKESWPAARVTAVGHDGSTYFIGTPSSLLVRDAYNGDDQRVIPMRGAPYALDEGDYDGDDVADLWVVSSDGNLYIIDGLTGTILETIDRDDVIVNVRLQDYDGDGLEDPYLSILSSGELFMGLFFIYDAQTVLVNRTGFDTVWRADGFAYRNAWADFNGDGVDDFLDSWGLDYDFNTGTFSSTVSAIDGKTGEQLFDRSVDAPGTFFFPNALVPIDSDGGVSLLAVDRWEGFVLLDGDGNPTAKKEWGTYYSGLCAGAVDLDGDGDDSAFVFLTGYDGRAGFEITVDGEISDAEGPDLDDIDDCIVEGIDNLRGGEDMFLMAVDSDGDGTQRYAGRIGEDGEVWGGKSTQGTPGYGYFTLIGADALAPDGGRLFYSYQDHVFAMNWDTGATVAEFTVNGPFVEEGVLIDIDDKRPAEVVALTGDGFVWALAEDIESVAKAVIKKADDQGKQLAPEVDGVLDLNETKEQLGLDEDKKTPGLGLGILFLALAALVRRR